MYNDLIRGEDICSAYADADTSNETIPSDLRTKKGIELIIGSDEKKYHIFNVLQRLNNDNSRLRICWCVRDDKMLTQIR